MNIFQKQLVTEIRKHKIDFTHFVDISHLSPIENKGYSTAILIGIALSRKYTQQVASTPKYVEQIKRNDTIQFDEFYLTELKTDKIADNIAQFIQEKGFSAYSQSKDNILKTGFYNSETKNTPLPHKTIAVYAGLGWIGKHNLLVTKKYGSAISMCTILTDAPIESTKQTPTSSHCGVCQICKEICKPKSIQGATWECGIDRDLLVNVSSCTTCLQCMIQCPWTQRYCNSIQQTT